MYDLPLLWRMKQILCPSNTTEWIFASLVVSWWRLLCHFTVCMDKCCCCSCCCSNPSPRRKFYLLAHMTRPGRYCISFEVHDDVIRLKHFPCYWPFVRGIHRSPVDSPHKGQWCRASMFSLICAWTSSWANNLDTGDLWRHHTHYDVTSDCCVCFVCFKQITRKGQINDFCYCSLIEKYD